MNLWTRIQENRETSIRAAKGLGVVVLLVLLMAWLAGSFVKKVDRESPSSKPEVRKPATSKVERRVFPLLVDQLGTVRAQTEAAVSSRIMAQVAEIRVKEGDMVRGEEEGGESTVMAVLRDADIQARLRQAEAQIESLNRAVEAARAKLGAAGAQVDAARAGRDRSVADYRRVEALRRGAAATGRDMENARAQKDVAEANVTAAVKEARAAESDIKRIEAQREQAEAAAAEARVMLGYATIRAPFTGRILKKMINVGDTVSPAQPMFLLETSSQPELHAFVSESLIHRVKFGQSMEVYVDALNRSFQGTVREITPRSDPSSRTVPVKVSLPSAPELVNGLFGRLKVPYGEYEALVIPRKAAREVGQLTLVETIGADGLPRRRFVTLGRTRGDLVEALSGLHENEEVTVP